MKTKLAILIFALLLVALPASAQDSTAEPTAEASTGGAGVAVLEGQLAYTDPDLASYGTDPIVFLGDMSNLFTGKFNFSTEYLDLDSPQILGKITSDIRVSPFTYELRLPIDPGGKLHDVNHDGKTDTGVMVYNVNFTFNGIGDPYIDSREFIYYRSSLQSNDAATLFQMSGGKIVVFAPDDQQQFPSDWGADGKLFTDDDPVTSIGQGYTVVDLSSSPFSFDRSTSANVDILESEGDVLDDFSDQSYSEAFDSLIATLRKKYAFTDFHHVDWDALAETYRPKFVKAETDKSEGEYELALQDLLEQIPDGHVGINNAPYLNSLPFPPPEIAGGLGIAIRELDDGRAIVNYVLDGSPADEAGIELRAEILEVDGKPIGDVIAAGKGLNPPYASASLKRLDQEREAMRFAVDQDVTLTYKNPGETDAKTVTLTTIAEDESRVFSRNALYGKPADTDLPLEFRILDSGYGYVAIYSFNDDNRLTLILWQRAMQSFSNQGVPGIIVDMRSNGGGSPDIGNVMLGYFFDHPVYTGTEALYHPDVDKFVFDPVYDNTIEPAEEGVYHGKVALLTSPGCFSECEFFSYALTREQRATVVAQYPTGGLGGGIDHIALPGGVLIQYTAARAVDENGNIHLEGKGVVPDVKVPVDEDTLFSDGDPVMDAAVEWLDEATTVQAVDGGAVKVGDTKTGTLDSFSAANYTFTATDDVTLDISLTDADNALDTVLRVYDEDGNVLADNDDSADHAPNSEITDLDVKAGETVTIEASTYDPTDSGDYTLTVAEAA